MVAEGLSGHGGCGKVQRRDSTMKVSTEMAEMRVKTTTWNVEGV